MCDLGRPVTEDMSYLERLEVLGDDSYGYEDSLSGQPGNLIMMTLAIKRNGVIGMMLMRQKDIITPIVCLRMEDLFISRMISGWTWIR